MSATVKLYRSTEGYAVSTDAIDERDFLQASAAALADKSIGIEEMAAYLPRVADIVCKLRGYKAPTVTEKRVLTCGVGILPDDALMVTANGLGVLSEVAA